MTGLPDRLERDLREIAAGARPSPSAWASIVARLDDDATLATTLELAPARSRSTRGLRIAAAVALFVIIGSVAVLSKDGADQSISAGRGQTFVSPRNGYSVEHDGSVTPAVQLLGFSEERDDAFDIVDTGSDALFKGLSKPLSVRRPGAAMDDQIDGHLSDDIRETCGVPRREQAEITIDGHRGRVVECQGRIEATVVAEQRLYYFVLTHDRDDARDVFDTFIDTIDLHPDTAVDVLGLTSTFVSPTYGYSFGYFDRGGPEPATAQWDPASGKLDDGLDAVETGLGAYFAAASIEAPDVPSLDAWVDEHFAPHECGLLRSRQEEVTIDGHRGRMARCDDRIEATVVAGGRLYYFSLQHTRTDARKFFDAWVATIELTPETAT